MYTLIYNSVTMTSIFFIFIYNNISLRSTVLRLIYNVPTRTNWLSKPSIPKKKKGITLFILPEKLYALYIHKKKKNYKIH